MVLAFLKPDSIVALDLPNKIDKESESDFIFFSKFSVSFYQQIRFSLGTPRILVSHEWAVGKHFPLSPLHTTLRQFSFQWGERRNSRKIVTRGEVCIAQRKIQLPTYMKQIISLIK